MNIFIPSWVIKIIVFTILWLLIGFFLTKRRVDDFYVDSGPGFYNFWSWFQFYFWTFLLCIFLWPWVHFIAPLIVDPILNWLDGWRMKKLVAKIDFSKIRRP